MPERPVMLDTSKVAFVMFGQSPRFGDYLDIINACSGFLKKVVVNVDDPAPAGSRTFNDRLRDANQFLERSDPEHRIAVEHIDVFQPGARERYVVGFRGVHVRLLRDTLRTKFAIAFDSLIHPSAIISPFKRFGEGIIVGAGTIVASGVALGDFCMVNRGCNIGHDATIGPYTNIGPGANLASGVIVGDGAVVGIGATIIENIKIGTGALVAAGAVVTRDVEPGAMVAGNPATFKKMWKRSA
jgi:sugar O-acyltransferase (sialic acid O-acetyltransferase NeuD family)